MSKTEENKIFSNDITLKNLRLEIVQHLDPKVDTANRDETTHNTLVLQLFTSPGYL